MTLEKIKSRKLFENRNIFILMEWIIKIKDLLLLKIYIKLYLNVLLIFY